MGISTQPLSQAAQQAVNQGLARSVTVANASLTAQQTISNGTADLAKSAMADNSTVTLSETRVRFNDEPASISTSPIKPGQLVLSPSEEFQFPQPNNLITPNVEGLPTLSNPEQTAPGSTIYIPGLSGDLTIPGGMARLEDVSLGAVTVDISPKAPEFTAPVLSTSPSENPSQGAFDAAVRHYVDVVLVGSGASIAQSATEGGPPTGP